MRHSYLAFSNFQRRSTVIQRRFINSAPRDAPVSLAANTSSLDGRREGEGEEKREENQQI